MVIFQYFGKVKIYDDTQKFYFSDSNFLGSWDNAEDEYASSK